MRINMTAAVLTTSALLLAGCGDDEGSTERLQGAACADLHSGMDIQAVANSGVQNGLSKSRVAAVLITAVNEQCPEFEDELQESLVPGWLD